MKARELIEVYKHKYRQLTKEIDSKTNHCNIERDLQLERALIAGVITNLELIVENEK